MQKTPRFPAPIAWLIPLLLLVATSGYAGDDPLPLEVTDSPFDSPVTVTARGAEQVESGETFEVTFDIEIERGWHIYSFEISDQIGDPPRLIVTDPGPFEISGKPMEPKPHSRFDQIFAPASAGVPLLEHSGEVTFKQALLAPAGLKNGLYPIKVQFSFYVCDAMLCLPEETLEFVLPVAAGMAVPVGGGALLPMEVTLGEFGAEVSVTARGAEDIDPGEPFELTVIAEIERGWHIYGMKLNPEKGIPTEIKITDSGPFEIRGPVTEPPPHSRFDPIIAKVEEGIPLLEHAGDVTFKLPLLAPEGMATGEHAVDVEMTYQVCDARVCMPPETVTFSLPVVVGGKRSVTDQQTSPTLSDVSTISSGSVSIEASLDRQQLHAGDEVILTIKGEVLEDGERIPAIRKDFAASGFWGVIVASVLAAFVALLTPCVYPMIPITISVFTKQAHEKRSVVFALTGLFGFGVIASFTALGFLLSAILGEGGANFMATNGWVNLAIGVLFIVFAFSLFGYFDIQLPAWLRNQAGGGGSSGGAASVLLMGLVFSITTFTCVGPIVASLLALAAGAGKGYAAIGMLTFSATIALPFMVLGLFPKALTGLPRSGGWLSTVKVILGFVELLAAWKFFSAVAVYFHLEEVVTREVIFAIWGVTLLLMAANLIGKLRFPHDAPVTSIGFGRGVLLLLTVVSAGWCFAAVNGVRLNGNLEAQLLTRSIYERHRLPWLIFDRETDLSFDTEREKIALALTQGEAQPRPLFINFTGHN